MPLVLPFFTAFVLTAILVPIVGRIARAQGLYAHPTYDRWHRRPVPNVGGIAMLIPLVAVLAINGVAGRMAPVIVAAVLMFAMGFADDLRPFRPGTKLVFQMIVAAVLIFLLPEFASPGNRCSI